MKDDSSFLIAFILPICQSMATGVFTILAMLEVCKLFSWPTDIAFMVGGTALLYSWLNFRGRLTHVVEFVLQTDLDGDGVIGTPMPKLPPPSTRIELIKTDPDHNVIEGDYINLPADQEQLTRLADGLQRGYSFSVQAWTGPGKPFTRSQFEALRNELHSRGWIAPLSDKSAKAGYELTAVGRHVLTRLAKSTTTPTHFDIYTPKK